jgi:hypothetical protein
MERLPSGRRRGADHPFRLAADRPIAPVAIVVAAVLVVAIAATVVAGVDAALGGRLSGYAADLIWAAWRWPALFVLAAIALRLGWGR